MKKARMKNQRLKMFCVIFPTRCLESVHKLYRYVTPQRVGFLRRFGLKTGIDFVHFDLKLGFGSRELRECMNVFIVSVPNEVEKRIRMRIRDGF